MDIKSYFLLIDYMTIRGRGAREGPDGRQLTPALQRVVIMMIVIVIMIILISIIINMIICTYIYIYALYIYIYIYVI